MLAEELLTAVGVQQLLVGKEAVTTLTLRDAARQTPFLVGCEGLQAVWALTILHPPEAI
jgi:hypothetical protein